jgi:hypothetical protein
MRPEALRTPGRWLGPLILVAGLVAGCAGDPEPEPAPADGTEVPTDPMEGLQLIVGIDVASYPPEGAMQVHLQWLNRLESPRTLEFPTSQRYDFLILDGEGGEVYRWSAERSFLQVLGSETLHPGEEGLVWEETLMAPAAPGEYRLVARVESRDGEMEASLPFEVRSNDGTP